jgi:hypothetical protein
LGEVKFVDEVEMILNEYNLNAKIIGGKIINIFRYQIFNTFS